MIERPQHQSAGKLRQDRRHSEEYHQAGHQHDGPPLRVWDLLTRFAPGVAHVVCGRLRDDGDLKCDTLGGTHAAEHGHPFRMIEQDCPLSEFSARRAAERSYEEILCAGVSILFRLKDCRTETGWGLKKTRGERVPAQALSQKKYKNCARKAKAATGGYRPTADGQESRKRTITN